MEMHGTEYSALQADISLEALRKTEERFTAAQNALELMHEIRNPLEALGHLIYLTGENADSAAHVRKYVHLAEEQAATLSGIVNQSLGFARSSHLPKPTDLVGLVEAAVRIHQKGIQAKNVHVVKDLPTELVANVHRGEMLQVVSNLIANALEALPDYGTLRLRLRRSAGRIHVMVADDGHGVSAGHLNNIFQPFFTTKEDGGTGLGLTLSKKIIELHFGTIRMRSSDREGKSGTTFRISLPG